MKHCAEKFIYSKLNRVYKRRRPHRVCVRACAVGSEIEI